MRILPFLLLLLAGSGFSQTSGTITIQKEQPDTNKTDTANQESVTPRPQPVRLSGLFVSDWVSDQYRSGNQVSVVQTRYYFYYAGGHEVYVFKSAGKPSKVLKALKKNPGKLAEEVGYYELEDGILYVETQSMNGNEIYRYTGEANPGKMWLGSKSMYRKKMQLDLYLSRYVQ